MAHRAEFWLGFNGGYVVDMGATRNIEILTLLTSAKAAPQKAMVSG
jgi:hypothetical protein